MLVVKEFETLQHAQGFIEGLSYVNESSIWDLKDPYQNIDGQWVVEFQDEDSEED